MTDLSDQKLMESYLEGDETAFAELYRRHSRKVYAFLQKKLKSREECDEVFQKVFLKFHQSRRRYNPDYAVIQWLYVISKTTLLDHYRAQNRQITTDDTPIENIPNLESQNEPHSSLNTNEGTSLLSSLSGVQRQAVEMRVLQELSYDEIAKVLNRSQDSVRQLLSRSLKKLRGSK